MEPLYQTLQDFFRRLGLPLRQDLGMTVHRLEGLHGDGPLESPLFRTNYYSFLLIRGGRSRYSVDGLSFELGRNSFYFTNPGHLKSFRIDEPLAGFMLTFTESFVRQYVPGDFFQQFPFLLRETIPVMTLDDNRAGELALIWTQMLDEYNGASPYKNAILVSQLSILLFKTKELLLSHRATLPAASRPAELAIAFRNALADNFRLLAAGEADRIWSVKEFSARLNLHPNYLTNVVKNETGKSPTDWIRERTLAEALALLRGSGKTVTEIAFALGFSDSTHFARFVKKQTGKSPTEHRQAPDL